MKTQNSLTPGELTEEVDFIQPLSIGCGLDVHKNTIEACIMGKGRSPCLRSYGTLTKDLKQLCCWIKEEGVQAVALESTGVYWYGIYQLLEQEGVRVKLVNPARVKQIPGKKTDVSDCKWLCKLLINGLVEGSFVPSGVHRELRELMRLRFKYVNLASQVENRLLKVLERANIKIRSVMSNITTKSGMAIVEALSEGETDVDRLASLCKGKLRKKASQMKEALVGLLSAADRMQLKILLKDQRHYAQQIAELEQQANLLVADHFGEAVEIIDSVPGIGSVGATSIVGEIGSSMSQFETADNLTSWSGLAPGNKESGGKQKKTRTVKGNRYIKPMLVQAAWAAIRGKDTYWSAQFYALTKRMPRKKAIIVIARKMLKMIHSLLLRKVRYVELGAAGFWEGVKLRRQARQVMPVTA